MRLKPKSRWYVLVGKCVIGNFELGNYEVGEFEVENVPWMLLIHKNLYYQQLTIFNEVFPSSNFQIGLGLSNTNYNFSTTLSNWKYASQFVFSLK